MPAPKSKAGLEEDEGALTVTLTLRMSHELRRDLEIAAGVWKVSVSSIARRAIEDGLVSWQMPQLGAELEDRLARIERCAVAAWAILNLEVEGKMDEDWDRRFRALKSVALADGEVR